MKLPRFARPLQLGILTVIILTVIALSPLPACPNCKEVVSENSAAVASGFNKTILLMLGLVGVMGSLITGLVVWVVRVENAETAVKKANQQS